MMIDFPVVEYEAHPAFADLAVAPTDASGRVQRLVDDIDSLLADVRAGSGRPSRGRLSRRFRAEIDPRLQEVIDIATECVAGFPREVEAIAAARATARSELWDQALYANAKQLYSPAHAGGPSSEAVAEEMAEHGICLRHVEAQRLREIDQHLEQPRREADELQRSSPGIRHQVRLPARGACWNAVEALLRDTGLLRGLADYERHDLRLAYCVLELSHEDQSWWKNCYADAVTATSRTAYFHNDHSFNVPKALLYLSDVDDEQGPFCFIPGSHRWSRSITGTLLVKALDIGHTRTWGSQDGEAEYYRPHFQSAEFRAAFMKLPRPLRATSHFGDDVLDGSRLSDLLLEQQWVGRSSEANCIAFDGGTGLHRGGLVRRGKRYALQIGFREPVKRSAAKRLIRAGERFFRKQVRGA